MPLPAASTAQALGSLEHVASGSALDRLRLIPVLGELGGASTALHRINGLYAGSPDMRRDIATLRTIYTAGPGEVAAADRAELIRRHGWFGELALAYGEPRDNAATAESSRAPAGAVPCSRWRRRSCRGGGIAGLSLSIVATVLLFTGRLRPMYRRLSAPSTVYLEAFTIYLASMVTLSLLARWFFVRTPLWMTPVVFMFLPLALVYPRLRGMPARLATGRGRHRGRGWGARRGRGSWAIWRGCLSSGWGWSSRSF